MARAKKRRNTPLEQTREAVHRANSQDPGAPPDLAPAPLFDLETLPVAMLRCRELLYAWSTSRRFEFHLRLLCARHGIPMDCAGPSVELLTIFVESELVDRVMHPELYRREDIEPDDDDETVASEEDAIHQGLTIVRPPTRKKLQPTLPGCQAQLFTGVPCDDLRRYGARFCPSHSKAYLAWIKTR